MRRMCVVVVVGLLVMLMGCSHQPTEVESRSSAVAQRQAEAQTCIDLWLNSGKLSPAAIENGLLPERNSAGTPIPDSSPLYVGDDGLYHARFSAQGIDEWCDQYNVPLADIRTAILNGEGCPFSAG